MSVSDAPSKRQRKLSEVRLPAMPVQRDGAIKETARSSVSKPTIANWDDVKLSDYAGGCCILKMNARETRPPNRV
jgi:hypothetical protein